MKKPKSVYKSIRKTWSFNPKTRVKDDRREEPVDICSECGCLDNHCCKICRGK